MLSSLGLKDSYAKQVCVQTPKKACTCLEDHSSIDSRLIIADSTTLPLRRTDWQSGELGV